MNDYIKLKNVIYKNNIFYLNENIQNIDNLYR